MSKFATITDYEKNQVFWKKRSYFFKKDPKVLSCVVITLMSQHPQTSSIHTPKINYTQI